MGLSFVEALQAASPAGLLFNPWRDWIDGIDIGAEAPVIRADNLTRYLTARAQSAQLLIIAEAAGLPASPFHLPEMRKCL